MQPVGNRGTYPPTLLLCLGHYEVSLHAGIAAWAREHDWELDTSLISGAHLPEAAEWSAVVATIDRQETVDWLLGLGCPVVRMLEASSPGLTAQSSAFPKIDCDCESIGEAGARHLLTLGKAQFGFYCQTGRADGRAVQRGFERVMRTAGQGTFLLDFRTEHPAIPVGQPVSRRQLLEWLKTKLSSLTLPAAIMAEDDRFALALTQAANWLGLRVPEDVAILGVDDNRLILGASPLGISSVDSNLRSVGYRAADLAARLVVGESPPETPILIPARQVVPRESTAIFHGEHRKTDAALRYIRTHFRSPIDVESVASHVGLQPRALQKIMANEACPTIHQEILRLRLEAAERLLLETDLKLEAIAAETGMGNSKNLCRLFAQHRGVTPNSCRRR